MAGRKRKPRSVFPLHGKAQADAPPAVETSVEAFWPPLTPEHGFPSLRFRPGHRALPLCPLPVSRGAGILSRNTSFLVKTQSPAAKKTRATRPAAKLRCHFLYRHCPYQVRRVEAGRFLSALRLPCGFRPHSTSPAGGVSRAAGIFCEKIRKPSCNGGAGGVK